MIRAMIRRISLVVLLASAAVCGSAAPASSAEMYRWVDDQGNAHYSEGLDSIPERFRARASRLLYQSAPVPAPPAPGAGADTVVRFTPGEPIYVTARINDAASARLILDTGATRTVVNPRALVAAGVSTRTGGATGRIRGVTGTADVQAYDILSLQVGNAKVGRMLVVSHDVEGAQSDGLLGRDFLDQVKVTIDNTAGRVTLSPK